MKNSIFILIVLFSYTGLQSQPEMIKKYISGIHIGLIGDSEPKVSYQVISNRMLKVSISWTLSNPVAQDDVQVNILPGFTPSFHWASHLSPTDSSIIAQHVFRAPAMIMSSEGKQISILPDLEILGRGSPVDWYMDLDARKNIFTLGMSKSRLSGHVIYVREKGAAYPAGKIDFGFYILVASDKESIFDPWRSILDFYWNKFAEPLYNSGQPLEQKEMGPYVKHTYDWAFDNWRKNTWQEFKLKDKTVGGIVFIVNVTQSPDYPGEVNEREFRSIWNQAWFSSLRSASGLFRYARKNNDSVLLYDARKTKELALAFPQNHGFFDAVIATEMEQKQIGDKTYNRSKGWRTAYFGNSDRNPYSRNAGTAPYHILDMSYTASLMLDWFSELEKDTALLTYATSYADALLKIQDSSGFFPAWLTKDSLKPLPIFRHSPETSMSVTFLLKLYGLTKNKKYFNPAIRAMNAIMQHIVMSGRWEDFETYYSCSGYFADSIGKKIARNDQYKQNTLSMYWTAEALLNCYQVTNKKKYLDDGRRTLDEMLMYQAVWQPPYMYVSTLGGFGVMNSDGEWNDSRQSLFAELILRYGRQYENEEYEQRALAALRASFAMMYCPENPKTKKQWEKVWTFFGPKEYGFMMENYGHEGRTSPDGVGIGEFTIYDWGNGAASETYNRMVDHYGKDFIENK